MNDTAQELTVQFGRFKHRTNDKGFLCNAEQ